MKLSEVKFVASVQIQGLDHTMRIHSAKVESLAFESGFVTIQTRKSKDAPMLMTLVPAANVEFMWAATESKK